jgi:hypothetical protein
MSQRKVIQIQTDANSYFYALCTDGTMWKLTPAKGAIPHSWAQLPAVPSGDEDTGSPNPPARNMWNPEGGAQG